MLHLDVELSDEQKRRMETIPPETWFTQVIFRNARSPLHPNAQLAENNEYKQELVQDWIGRCVRGRTVLDLFSANGAFSIMAAQAGAAEVVGVEFSLERVECARFVASTVDLPCKIEFIVGDVYKLSEMLNRKFDVGLCLGGLYHIADPAFVLRQLGELVTERLIMQTSQVLPLPGNWGRFVVRRQDKTAQGLTSIRGGYGAWHLTPACVRELLHHGGFEVLEDRLPPWRKIRRFPWYLALCEPLR